MRPSVVLSSIFRVRICSPKAFSEVLDATTLVNGKLGARDVGLIGSISNQKYLKKKIFLFFITYLKYKIIPFESTIGDPMLAILT
jgi:hypothetical protein